MLLIQRMKICTFGLICFFAILLFCFQDVLQAEQSYPGTGWEKAKSPEAIRLVI